MPVRRIVALFAAALVVAGLGYTAYWFHAAASLRKGVQDWAQDHRARGWQVEWRDLRTAGFPLHLRLELDGLHLADAGGRAWRADRLDVHAAPFDWTRLRLTTGGRHQVAWPGGEAQVDMQSARAEVNLTRAGDLDDATVLAAHVRVTRAGQPPVSVAGLAMTVDPLTVAQPSHATATVAFSLTAHDVELPPLPDLPLDPAIGLAEITGRVMGALPVAAPAQAVRQWSADGGTVELDHVTLEWAPVALEAQGTLALDPAGQPLLSLATRMRGFGPLMDRLAGAGAVSADAATAAKTMLLLLAKPDAKGRPSVPVPVSLQDGGLYLGPARVARMPAIDWP